MENILSKERKKFNNNNITTFLEKDNIVICTLSLIVITCTALYLSYNVL